MSQILPTSALSRTPSITELLENPRVDLTLVLSEFGFDVAKLATDKHLQLQLVIQQLHLYDVASSLHLPYTWFLEDDNLPVQFVSEMAVLQWKRTLVLFGPVSQQSATSSSISSSSSSSSRPVVVVALRDLDTGEWRVMNVEGKVPNFFMMFKKLPLTWIHGDNLFVCYSNMEGNRVSVDVVSLVTIHCQELAVSGAVPPLRDIVDGCFHQNKLVLSGAPTNDPMSVANVVHQLDLSTRVWSLVPTTGSPSPHANGASLVYDNKLLNFSHSGDALYSLDLETFVWTRRMVISKLPLFMPRRHSHLMCLRGDKFFLVRLADGFAMNVFDLNTLEWKTMPTFGRRPGLVRTEASMVIVGDELIALGGQVADNHLVSISLDDSKEPPSRDPEDPASTFVDEQALLSRLYNDGFEDSGFVTTGGFAVNFHRTVLASKSVVLRDHLKKFPQERVLLENTSPEACAALVKAFYNILEPGEIHQMSAAHFAEVSRLAQDFQATDVIRFLVKTSSSNLAVDSCLGMLIKLSAAEATRLYADALTRVLAFSLEHIDEITITQAFADACFSHPQVVQLLFTNAKGERRKRKREVSTADAPQQSLFGRLWLKKSRS